MKILTLCKKYLLTHKYILAVYICITLLSTALGILLPFIIGNFLDIFVEGATTNDIYRFAIIFGGISILKILKGYAATIINIKMQYNMSYAYKRDTINHIQSLSLSYINKQDSAYLNQRIGTDISSLISFCVSILQSMISNIVIIIAPFVILLTMNRFVAMLLLLFFVVYAALYFIFKKSLYNAGYSLMEAQNKFFSRLLERLRYVKLIKINSINPQMNQRTDESFTTTKNAAIHNQKVSYLYSGLDGFVSTIAQIVLFVVGGLQILAGNFTIGMFTIFTSYFNMILGAGRYFFGLGAYYQQTLVAHDRICEILAHNPEQWGNMQLDDINKIELRNVAFSYNGEKTALQYTAAFEKGNIYCISGANGAGKSTLVSLVMGLYINEYSGAIMYNGTDVKEIDLFAARKNLMSFSEQEPFLFNDTIEYNLTFGMGEVPDISKYAKLLNMEDFLQDHGLDFVINEKNSNLSGGEKQKISILKTLCKNAPVMIFDEPTSALDANTTQRFMEYLQQIKQGKIIILISHDMAVKGKCDHEYSL